MKVWVNWFKSKTKTLGHKRALTLPYNLPRLFIFSQPNKLRVPQVTIWCPFRKLDLCDHTQFFISSLVKAHIVRFFSGRLANGQELTPAFRPAFRTS